MFKKIVMFTIAAMLLTSAGFAVSGVKSGSNNLTLTGSTTVLPIAQAAAEYYMGNVDKKLKITINGGGSSNGIKAILDGTADIGNASREIADKEKATAKEKGVKVSEIAIALDGIVVVVNKSVKVENLTMDQLKKIFNGEVKNWKEVGGVDGEIVVVSRDTSSGTYGSFTEMVLGKDKMRADAMMTASNQGVATTVAQTPNSIGYIGLGFLKSVKDIHSVKVNGIDANEDNVKNKSYKLSRFLYMYTNGAPKGNTKKFIDFILSSKGQDIVEKQDYIKLK